MENSARHPGFLGSLARSSVPAILFIAAAATLHFSLAGRESMEFATKLLLSIGINIILAVSLNIVNGFTGQFSIGHAGFMGVGAYTAAAISYYVSIGIWDSPAVRKGFAGPGEWLFVGACLAGGMVAAVAGLIVGLPSLRLRGDYLAIVTLGFAEIFRILIRMSEPILDTSDDVAEHIKHWYDYFGYLGSGIGFTGVGYYNSLFWTYVFVGLTLLTAYRIKQSSLGRGLLAIRENEVAAQAMGINVTFRKVQAFVIAAFIAGIAGGLYAHTSGNNLNPAADEVGFQRSFDIVIMVVLGGMGSISGAVVAAVVLTLLPEWLREPTHVWHVGLGLALAILGASRLRAWRLALGLAVAVGIFEAMRALAIYKGVALSEYRMCLYAISLIVMMILRPQGFFGLREVWDFPVFLRLARRTPISKTES